uniref:Integrase catalytic domain-containing protein n=1 Tax=Tanacetum cinerariifolium TaxID=118510 RepID=A0A6L2NZD5_TANCI|nr:hypothetical protein [Tanacetum cinerariifolium]
MSVLVTAEEKTNKKNDVKARILLLMALPNEHQLTSSQYNDAKTMFATIKTHFGGNEATMKTQKTLLKQQYENYNASNTESLNSFFNRIQKIFSRLAILGVVITQEYLNLKFLRGLPPEWNTHVVVWMNKADIEKISIDDLYNNFKIVEQDVKKSVGASTGAQNMAFMTAPSNDSTNDVNTTNPAYEVSIVSSNVNTISPQELEQIHEDDLEAMDLRWQLSPKEQRNQDGRFRNQDNTRKQGNNEDTYSKAMLAIDGVGFDWSDMAEEQVQTNIALMAFSNSEVYNDESCTKTCLKNYETLKKQCDDLIVKLNQIEFTATTYKRGLATVEEQLVTYKKNEVLFSKEVAVLKREVACKVMKQMESDTDNSKKGLGYHVVPPSFPLIYNGPTKLDLSYFGLDEFKQPEFKGYGPRDSKLESNIVCGKKSDDSKENSDDSFVKEQVSEDTSSFVESLFNVDKETGFSTDKKIKSVKPKIMKNQLESQLDFKEFDRGYVTFGGGAHGGRISSKATKDETNEILKNFIKETENLVDKKVKIIRCDNGTEFKNKVMDDFCREKCIKREYSVARTPQQNGVAERRNRTLIEAARTMLADSKLPTTFWAKAVSITCYVQNRVLIVKPHNKTPYELFIGFKPALSFMRPFRCHVAILNTLDNLGKFDGKSVESFFVGYSLSSKAFRVYNTRTRKLLHVQFLKNLQVYKEILMQDVGDDEPKSAFDDKKQVEDGSHNEDDGKDKSKDDSSPKEVIAAGQHVNTASLEVDIGRFELNTVAPSLNTASLSHPHSPKDMFKSGAIDTLRATHVEFFSDKYAPEVDLGNIPNSYAVPTTPHTGIHKDHSIKNVIGEVKSFVQTKRMTKPTSGKGFLSAVYEEKTHDILNNCLYACFLSQIENTSIAKALSDSSWVEAMQEKLLNKKDKSGIVIRNKARLVAQGHRKEEGIYYEEVFAPMARIKAIRLFLAYASFMGFLELHQAPREWYETLANYLLGNRFQRGKIDPTLFIKNKKEDILLVQVYVDDIIFGSTNKELCTAFEKLMKEKFQMSSMRELTFFLGLQVTQKEDGIFISHDKYVDEILKKFNYTDVKSASTPVDLEKPLVKYGDANDVDVLLYRSMIGSLMYLTTSRPDIMFAAFGIPRDSPFELVAYIDSDYAGATQDRKSIIGGFQFLGNGLISWQCKK